MRQKLASSNDDQTQGNHVIKKGVKASYNLLGKDMRYLIEVNVNA